MQDDEDCDGPHYSTAHQDTPHEGCEPLDSTFFLWLGRNGPWRPDRWSRVSSARPLPRLFRFHSPLPLKVRLGVLLDGQRVGCINIRSAIVGSRRGREGSILSGLQISRPGEEAIRPWFSRRNGDPDWVIHALLPKKVSNRGHTDQRMLITYPFVRSLIALVILSRSFGGTAASQWKLKVGRRIDEWSRHWSVPDLDNLHTCWNSWSVDDLR